MTDALLRESWAELAKEHGDKEFQAGLKRMQEVFAPKVRTLQDEIQRIISQYNTGKRD